MGEWNARKNTVGGLHWWYFYENRMKDMKYEGADYRISDPASGLPTPHIATMSFTWSVAGQRLKKPIGGFLIGPSVEGVMAMVMVRASNEAAAPNVAILEGMDLEWKMFKSNDRRSISTFYVVLRSVVLSPERTNEPTVAPPREDNGQPGGDAMQTAAPADDVGGMRILSVIANPEGADEGREKLTMMKMFGKLRTNLSGWVLRAPNRTALTFGDVSLERGEARTWTIPARGSLQLGNKGGEIQLARPDGAIEQTVEYERDVAKIQGGVLVWDENSNLVLLD